MGGSWKWWIPKSPWVSMLSHGSNLDEKWRRFQSDIMRHPEALHWPPKNGWCLGDVDPFYKIDVDPYIQKIK